MGRVNSIAFPERVSNYQSLHLTPEVCLRRIFFPCERYNPDLT
jgi:hypothetical protein